MQGSVEHESPGQVTSPGAYPRVLFGRRKGRPLRAGQQALVDGLLPRIEIPTPADDGPVDPAYLFSRPPEQVWLEVGFGAGEHLAAQARANPAVGIIGCEPFLNGVARLLAAIERDGLDNIRIFRDDARLLLAALTPASIARAFVLFPDPWPKKRHHKRRFLSSGNFAQLARVLGDNGELRIATDHPGYQAWILEHALGCAEFEWTAQRAADWRTRPEGWPATRYETKAVAAGRRCAFFRFRRRPRDP